jgi:hypothetical protein
MRYLAKLVGADADSDERLAGDRTDGSGVDAVSQWGTEMHAVPNELDTLVEVRREWNDDATATYRLVHRFHETDHLHGIHVVHDGLYPNF